MPLDYEAALSKYHERLGYVERKDCPHADCGEDVRQIVDAALEGNVLYEHDGEPRIGESFSDDALRNALEWGMVQVYPPKENPDAT